MLQARSLSGDWLFRLDAAAGGEYSDFLTERPIRVPLPWQAAFPALDQYRGYAVYSRTFDLDDTWLDRELLLDFGAVDYWCEVFVNDQRVGEHEGGYTPFRFAIRRYVHAGENTLRVRVYDTVQTEIVIPRTPRPASAAAEPPFDSTLIPHGKQTWYLDVSGIWQDVRLSAAPRRYIETVHVTPDIHTGAARVVVTFGGAAADAGTLRVTLDGETAQTQTAADQADVTVHAQRIQLWTPETPILYTLLVQWETDGVVDERVVRFGYREIGTRDGRLLLNGEPIYLLCALDQDLYPDTIYTVPSDAFLRDQFAKAKALGLNSLRCHIKPPDPRYLDLADEMGLLIWSEIPSWRTFHPKHTVHPSVLHLDETVKARAAQLLDEMIARDYNHPSLIIWTIINEDWGTALLLSESDRAWVAEMVARCRQLDPTRLVVDNSPCPAPWGLSVHVTSDLDDFHVYANIPDQAEQFEQFIEQFALRPLWSFSNTGDARRTGAEPLILSEFGNWGMPSLARYGASEPDWFRLGGWWSSWEGEPGYPFGVVERFGALGLDAIWRDYEAFAEASQWHEYHALKFEIETMRRLPGIQGYVITELSDIYWESNGLLDFARGTKAFHDCFARFNTPDLLVAQPNRYAFWDDETARLALHASHYSAADWSDVEARVSVGAEMLFSAALGTLRRGEAGQIGTLGWRVPQVESPADVTLSLDLAGAAVQAHNDLTVSVVPAALRRARFGGRVAALMRRLHDTADGELSPGAPLAVTAAAGDGWQSDEPGSGRTFAARLARLGYTVTTALDADTDLVITDQPTADSLRWVRDGGDLLFISHTAGSPFFWRQARSGAYGGNWITSFSWLKPGKHPRLPVSNPLTLPFADLMPLGVILGLSVTDKAVQDDFLAGQFAGWLRHPALHTVQFRYGRGRVVMTTYRLVDALATHPFATAMLHDLIDHLTSEACQPVLKANY